MSEWISVEDELPGQAEEVRTKGADGREFDTQLWLSGQNNERHSFKLIGYVWDHDNVTHWKPISNIELGHETS